MIEKYSFRSLAIDDWNTFNELEKLIFPDEPMSESSFKRGLSGKSSSFIALENKSKKFIGYYRVGVYGEEGHIYRIVVHPNYRRKGLGSVLLEKSMLELKKAGCSSYYLYVLENNTSAINLYKKYLFEIETNSWQFKIPFKLLPLKPKGKCRHIVREELESIAQKFHLNPHFLQQYFNYENEHLLLFEYQGQQLGFGRFSPYFPGAMPFIISDAKYTFDMVAHFKLYITNPEFDHIKITFDNQKLLVAYLKKKNIPINYELLKMRRFAYSNK